MLTLLRGEFIGILLISIGYLFIFFQISIRKILFIVLICLVVISPYVVRNILVFEKITITKSFGYNLWKGNNPQATVEGTEIVGQDLQKSINKIPINKFYGINFDKVHFNKAIENIYDDPQRYFILFIKKVISFLFIDINSSQPKYYNPLHYLPVLVLGTTALVGIFISDKKSHKLNYLILIFFANVFVFSIFFILPRYKLMILPLQIIFTNIIIKYIGKKFFTKKK